MQEISNLYSSARAAPALTARGLGSPHYKDGKTQDGNMRQGADRKAG